MPRDKNLYDGIRVQIFEYVVVVVADVVVVVVGVVAAVGYHSQSSTIINHYESYYEEVCQQSTVVIVVVATFPSILRLSSGLRRWAIAPPLCPPNARRGTSGTYQWLLAQCNIGS